MAKRMIVSDESVDADSERVLMRGARLERFKRNPVLFYMHDKYGLPIGKWKDIRIENGKLTAEPEFDMQDEYAREIARKYEQGFLKAASIGFRVYARSEDPAMMLPGQKRATITDWELIEVSIVSIPANPNALVIDKAVSDIQNKSVVFETEETTQEKDFLPQTDLDMTKFKTAIFALFALPAALNDDEDAAIKAIEKRLDDVIEAGVTLAKMPAFEQADSFKNLLKSNPSETAAIMKNLAVPVLVAPAQKPVEEKPEHVSLQKAIEDLKKSAAPQSSDDVPNMRELEKKNPKELMRIKREEPELFVKMFQKQYGKTPENVKV